MCCSVQQPMSAVEQGFNPFRSWCFNWPIRPGRDSFFHQYPYRIVSESIVFTETTRNIRKKNKGFLAWR